MRSLNPSGSFGSQVGEPFLEALLIEQLLDALARRQIEMVLALRADVEARLPLPCERWSPCTADSESTSPSGTPRFATDLHLPSLLRCLHRSMHSLSRERQLLLIQPQRQMCVLSLHCSSICASAANGVPSTYSRNAPPPVETCFILLGQAELLDRLRRFAAADDGDCLWTRPAPRPSLACPCCRARPRTCPAARSRPPCRPRSISSA